MTSNYKLLSLLASTIFLFIVGLSLAIEQIILMGAIIAGIIVFSFFSAYFSVGKVSCRRVVVESAFEGEELAVKIELKNGGRLSKFVLGVVDNLPPWVAASSPAKATIWGLGGRGCETIEYRVELQKRGVYKLGPITLVGTDPLGIFEYQRDLAVYSELVVYPSVVDIPNLKTYGGGTYGVSHWEGAAVIGDGTDFYSVRKYQPGDDLRRIHWRSTAKLDELAVIEFEHGTYSDVAIVLDLMEGTNLGEGKDSSLEYGVKIAGSIARNALRKGNRLQLFAYGAERKELVIVSEDMFYEVLELLARVEADGRVPISHVLEELGAKLAAGAHLFVVTSSEDERILTALAGLERMNLSVSVILLNPCSFVAMAAEKKLEFAKFVRDLASLGNLVYVIESGLDIGQQLEVAYFEGH